MLECCLELLLLGIPRLISYRRWLFIIEGAVTVYEPIYSFDVLTESDDNRVVALGAFFVLPNFPRTTTWLTEEERQLAIWRLDEDIGEDDWVGSKEQTFFHGMKLAFTDVKMYILVSCFLRANNSPG